MTASRHDISLLGVHEYFDAVFEAIDEAKQEIRVETYVFRFDATGNAMLNHLGAAAARGVSVYFMADGLGSPELTRERESLIGALGIEVVVYRRPWRARFTKLHGRMHRKIIAIDRRVLFLGGMNISDEYAGMDVPGAFYDLSVRVEGPVAEEAAALAERLFDEERLRRGARMWRRLKRGLGRRERGRAAGPRVRLVVRDNHRAQKDIESAYRAAIVGARRSIVLAHAYFLPSRSFVQSICDAAHRGVETTLIFQGRAEHAALRWAERRLYDRFLRAGAHIFEHQPRLLHVKAAVVDSRWSTIGSSNLEPWSLISNLEANLVIEDEAFAAQLETMLRECATRECIAFEMRRLGPMRRLASVIAYEVVLGVFVLTGGRRDPFWRSAHASAAD